MQDYFKSGLAKAGELAGAATVAAGAFAEVHPSIATRPIAPILFAGARPCWQTRERQSVCQVPPPSAGLSRWSELSFQGDIRRQDRS